MGGFETDGPVPDWLTERFDQHTTLPLGPLEHLPIPLDGCIVRASSSTGDQAERGHWSVGARCGEDIADTLRFYEEYLPLSGYQVLGAGTLRIRRSWLGRTTNAKIVVIHRDGYVGAVVLRPSDRPPETTVDVSMGHPTLDAYQQFSSVELMRMNPDVVWHRLDYPAD